MWLSKLYWQLERDWPRFWMRLAGLPCCRRFATRAALWWAPPYFQRHCLADLNPRGFISTRATVWGSAIQFGANVFVDDRVLIYQEADGGLIELGDRVRLQEDTHILTGAGGAVKIGTDTHLHRGCQLSAYKAPIRIGSRVEIAARCAFYSYDHGIVAGRPIADQPLTSKGEILVEDEAWLGYGVIVLSGVRIGKGAVIAAGSVVTTDVPDQAVAGGVPARVIKMRSEVID
jgi:acetyltransferase-like isoleucine patch superfamily enzyme